MTGVRTVPLEDRRLGRGKVRRHLWSPSTIRANPDWDTLASHFVSMQRIVILGAGGLGCAVGNALLHAKPDAKLVWVDPDRIEPSNLARQVLFAKDDIGRTKAEVAAERTREAGLDSEAVVSTFSVESGPSIVDKATLVMEGTDSYRTKFAAADVCVGAGIPIVHAGIVGWSGWALATRPRTSACLRCVFETPPEAGGVTCDGVGVMGSAVGTLGALQAALALQLLRAHTGAFLRFDALRSELRSSRLAPRADCPLCQAGTLRSEAP